MIANEIYRNGKDRLGKAELLAYSTLLTEGFPVRMTGQMFDERNLSHSTLVLKLEDSEENMFL